MFEYQGSLIIKYNLKLLTGLRIGGSKEQFEIGGVDNPVIKTGFPVFEYDGKNTLPEGAPYIPGSSLKGKIRSLLEWSRGVVKKHCDEAKKEEKISDQIKKAGSVCECGECEICKVFGTGNAKVLEGLPIDKQPGPPRLKVFDAYPTWDSIENLKDILGEGIYTEIKTENQINRITSHSNPRKMERVPAGVKFEGEMVFDFYKNEDKDLIEVVFEGMRLLEDNFIGGCGSRGYGKIKFENIKLIWRSKEFYKGQKEAEKTIEEVNSIDELLDKMNEIKTKLNGKE